MPPPPLKLRLLLLLPLIPSTLALLLLVMLVVDKPILFADRARCKFYYGGGAITYTNIKPDVWIGPSTETIISSFSGPEYKHFQEKLQWESSLPRVEFSHLGISYFSRPRAEDKGSNFVADRWSILSIRAEYLTAIAAGFLVWTVLLYRRARRAYVDLCRGYCPICGYDLRASPHKCPECGAVRA